jgi:hypothetical protein
MPLLTYCAVAGRSYLRVASSNCRRLSLFGLSLALLLGCTAGTKSSPTGVGGQNPIAGIGGTGGKVGPITGLGGDLGLAGFIGSGGATANPDAKSCMEYAVEFTPKTPTLYVLVDRSGSMFACVGETRSDAPPCATPANSYWEQLKSSILSVAQELQADVRLGFAAFNGTNGGTCPDIRKVSPALNNYSAIATLYNSLPFRTSSDKWETPTRRSLETIGAELSAITDPGDKYILFVTDGEPDYCGDGNLLCAPDSVVAELQALKAQPAPNSITTIVFGLQSKVGDISPTVLQAFANAGAGEPTKPPLRGTTDIYGFFDQCFPGGDSSTAGWKADFLKAHPECSGTMSNTCRGMTIGTYGDTAGPTKPFTPDPSSKTAIVTQLRAALSGVKSCSFDLGGHVMVNTQRLNEAVIKIDGTVVPLDPNNVNGWNMSTPTQLELHGGACDAWRGTGTDIHFGFPCDLIVG